MSGTPSIPFEINSVTLQKSHIRITRSATEDDPPFQTQNLVLWTKGATPSENPATIPLAGATLIINITYTNDQSFDFTLTGAVQDRQIGTSQRTTYNAGTASVDVAVVIAPSAAPWGSKGEVQWTYNMFLGSQNSTTTTQTPIQLYAISSDMAPMYQKSGIPQEMLDLFVDQYPNTGSSSITDWITWAVTRCHASSKDPLTKSLETIHSYTYNTFTGRPRFTEDLTFDLVGWLKLLPAQSSLITVNCYDQTAIVICALNLGLPYYLRSQDGQKVPEKTSSGEKGEDVPTLQRFFKGTWSEEPKPSAITDRFGYIKETDLVGWGNCNSPFFMGNKKNQIFVDGVSTEKRTSFKNHYFVCYNTLDSQETVVQNALDACAGPIAAPILIDDYLTKVIDAPPSQKLSGPSWTLTATLETNHPTNTINVLSLFKSTNTSKYKDRELWGVLAKAQDDRTVPTTPIGASFTSLSNSILSAINVKTGELDVDIAKDRSTISTEFSYLVNQEWVPFVTATIDVMKDFQSAQFQAMTRVYAMGRDWNTVFAIPTPAQYLGDVNLVSNPGLNVALIVYGNIVIFLEGDNSPKAQFDVLVKNIDVYMATAKKATFTPIVDTSFSVSMPSSVSVGVPFEIDITAPGIAVVEVESKSEIVQITKGPYETPGGWKLNCVAFETGKGTDQIAFGFAENGTYFPHTDIVKPIAIISPNLITNGDFQTGSLEPWVVNAGSNTINLEQPGLSGAKYKAVASVRSGDDPLSSVSLQQTLNTVQGKTYKLSAQVFFGGGWSSDCYVNIYVNGAYVVSRRAGAKKLTVDSNTFIATSDQSIVLVSLLATAYEEMTFELGYVTLELVP